MTTQIIHQKLLHSARQDGQILSSGDLEKLADSLWSDKQGTELAPNDQLPSVDRIIMRSTDSLKPHPSLADRGLLPGIERLQQLERYSPALFDEPLLITKSGIIVDGHARWLSARHLGVKSLPCIEWNLSEQEALERILQTHRQKQWLNSYCRGELALDLRPFYREIAHANQSAGGRGKASSKLTKAKRLDCRTEIAKVAGISTGSLSKVEQILELRYSRMLIDALRRRDISIHAAWLLRKLPASERESAFKNRLLKKLSKKRIRRMIGSVSGDCDSEILDLREALVNLRRLLDNPKASTTWPLIVKLVHAIESIYLSEGVTEDATECVD